MNVRLFYFLYYFLAFKRANLSLPPAPEYKSVSAYPLVLEETTINEPNDYNSKKVFLRARRSYKDWIKQHYGGDKIEEVEDNSSILSDDNSNISSSKQDDASRTAEEQMYLYEHVVKQLKSWSETEEKVRLDRKHLQANDRLEAIVKYREALITSLHSRFHNNRSTTREDKQYQLAIEEKFPFITSEEPVIFESKCTYNGMKGSRTSNSKLFSSSIVFTFFIFRSQGGYVFKCWSHTFLQ